MKTSLLIFLLLASTYQAFSHFDLRVGDPRNSWQTEQGTIEEANLTISPRGLYMEYGLYLTFSSEGTKWINEKDTLEVTLDFSLPENAMITDSWLWFGEDTIKAVILDRWTASSIYESIVRRRRDPSILFKQSATQYQLRIFPMAGNETRKVKITYMVPVNWNRTTISANLPFPILKTSRTLPATFNIYTWESKQWKNPVILGDDNLLIQQEKDDNFGECKMVGIPSSKFNENLKIAFDTPLKDGYYFSKFQSGDEGYYQLAVSPSSFLTNTTGNKKIAVLVDYDISNSELKIPDLLQILKEEMQQNLNPTDSFNLFFSNLSILKHSDKWVLATHQNIESAFHILGSNISEYSNLPSLLAEGVKFVKNNGNDGKILLASNSSEYGDFEVANQLIDDILALMDEKIQIHVADYQTLNHYYYVMDRAQFMGNSYFYSNLAKLTGGSYQNLTNGITEAELFSTTFKYMHGSINSFDFHTKLENGFCYSRFNLNRDENVVYLNEMILQVGKFKGDLPFTIDFSGEYKKEIFSEKIVIDENGQGDNDSLVQKIWAGAFIKSMEKDYSSNDIVSEIIDESVKNRILSLYTSFLCLEDTSNWCLTCKEETWFRNDLIDFEGPVLTGNSLIEISDTVSVYPNPFTDHVTIDIQLTENSEIEDLTIYDLKGAVVYKFEVNQIKSGSNKSIRWNGLAQNGSAVKPGIYILSYRTLNTSKTLKLIKR
jgi:Ca-activated chloride channel family protein